MKSRWLINLLLLVLIAGISIFLHLRPKTPVQNAQNFEISNLKLGAFKQISIENPAKAPVVFEKKDDGLWYLEKPYHARAEQMLILRILSLVGAKSSDKFPANDLDRFGLNSPKLKLKFDDAEFSFGTFNPVTSDQYVSFKDSVYLLPVSYAESAQMPVVEYLDKSPMRANEKIVGFDFSHLEQWEETRLNVDLVDGKWTASAPKAKPVQNEMNEWMDAYWSHMSVASVEPYTPDRKATYPSFEVKLKDGKKVHFDKIQESPELLLGRPDEGMMYHVPQDIGFNLLNPPINLSK
jgi:hypothetical protein